MMTLRKAILTGKLEEVITEHARDKRGDLGQGERHYQACCSGDCESRSGSIKEGS